jgi:hypothetical protein
MHCTVVNPDTQSVASATQFKTQTERPKTYVELRTGEWFGNITTNMRNVRLEKPVAVGDDVASGTDLEGISSYEE